MHCAASVPLSEMGFRCKISKTTPPVSLRPAPHHGYVQHVNNQKQANKSHSIVTFKMISFNGNKTLKSINSPAHFKLD